MYIFLNSNSNFKWSQRNYFKNPTELFYNISLNLSICSFVKDSG